MLAEHYILTLDPHLGEVFHFIESNHIDHRVHLNRTRFWIVPNTPLYTEFLLRYSHCCPQV